MSTTNVFGNEVSVDERAFKQTTQGAIDEDGFEIVDETPEFRPSVEMEIQAKVDSNHPDARIEEGVDHMYGKTLEEEERIRGREAELRRISAKAVFGTQEGREERTRTIVAKQSTNRRIAFQKRASSVDPMVDPDREDPREELTQTQVGVVNAEAMRLAKRLNGWSPAAIGRHLGEAILSGSDLMSAVISVYEQLQSEPGRIMPISELERVDRKEVAIEGRVEKLWEPSHPAIAQVGLIGDESSRTRVTIWEKSGAPWIDEGEHVRIYGVARNWYEGRVSLAVTGWSTIHFPEDDRWWQ